MTLTIVLIILAVVVAARRTLLRRVIMARIPGTFARSRFELVPNPAYAGRTPTPLKAACHDGSPFVTIRCQCGYQLHQHESNVARIPAADEIASTCLGCGRVLVFEPGFFLRAFQQLRDAGWIEE